MVARVLRSIGNRSECIASSAFFIPVIGVVIILNAGWLFWNLSKTRMLLANPLMQGDRLPAIEGVDLLNKKRIKINAGTWQLIMYYGRESSLDIGKVKYVDLLAKKYKGNLSATAIITSDCQKLKAMAEQRALSYPLILDERKHIAGLLGLGNRTHATLVVDPSGIIRFAATAPHVEEEDIRQLVEKFLVGKVSYAESISNRSIRVGDSFPSLLLQEIGSGELISLNEGTKGAYNPYVIFTADCAACSLGPYMHSFQLLHKLIEAKGLRAMAIFSSRFSRDELLEQARLHKVTAPFYIAKSEIPGFEDTYYLKSLASEVVVVAVDSKGAIDGIYTLNEYIDKVTNLNKEK